MSTAPPKPPPSPPPKASPPAARTAPPNGQSVTPSANRRFGVKAGTQAKFQRVILYGPGGVGKTELCSNLKALGLRPLFVDIGTGSGFLDVERVEPAPQSWEDLRAVLHDQELWRNHNAVVIDDLTTAESLAIAWTLANVRAERRDGGSITVNSIEGYGWGKGYTHVYETFLQLLGDLDMHVRAGRMVICVAHECTARVPNPAGDDYIRYEPRLQNTDKGNIRSRVKEWCDHLLFVGYDVFSKDGKATGAGTRTIYGCEMPTHLAKSRLGIDAIVYEKGSAEVWKRIMQSA